MNQDGGRIPKRTSHRENCGSNAKNGKRSGHTDDLNGAGLKGDESIGTRAQALPCSRIHVKNDIARGLRKRQTRNRGGFESIAGAGKTSSFVDLRS